MITQPTYQSSLNQQRGAVLIVSLMILIILTMLGISVMDSTKLQTRMALNTAESNRALQAAEVGIAQASSELIHDKKVLETVIVELTKDGDTTKGSYPIQQLSVKQGGGVDPIKSPIAYAIRAAHCPVPNDSGPQLPIYMESIGQSREDTDSAEVILAAGMVYPMPKEAGTLYETADCQ